MVDVCSRLEEVTEKIWSEPPIRVPARALAIRDRIAADAGVLFMKPALRATRLKCPTNFSGRWFPNRNAVGFSLGDDWLFTKGILVHEIGGHWQRWVFGGDEPGEHDKEFYALMEIMYPRYGIPLSIALKIEARPPKSWLERKAW